MDTFCKECGSRIDQSTGLCPNCNTPKRFCNNCGSPLDPSTGLCPFCYNTEPQKQTVIKTRSSGLKITLTIVMSILVFVLLLVTTLFLDIRLILSKNNLEKVVKDIEFEDMVDIGGNEAERALDNLYYKFERDFEMPIDQGSLEELYEDTTFVSFFVEKIADFSDNIIKGKGQLTISKKEIRDLIDDNRKKVEKELGVSLSSEEIDTITGYMINDSKAKIISTSEIKAFAPDLFSFVTFCLSYVTITVLFILIALIIFLMVLNSPSQACVSVGIISLIVSTVFGAASFVCSLIKIPFTEILVNLIAPSTTIAIILAVIGVLLIAAGIVIPRLSKKA